MTQRDHNAIASPPVPTPALSAIVLLRGPLPTGLEAAYRGASADPPLLTLARALTASRGWPSTRPAVIVARPHPTPVLVAIGRFDDVDQARIQALAVQLRTVLPRTRVLDHATAEAACERLAERLEERFGGDAIATMRFVGVPRGGLIVLGMLAYALGLRPAQLEAGRDGGSLDAPLVVVDDSVISGLRMRQVLTQRPERRLVVACLHSHPDARAALQERDRRIVDVLSAHDLHDHAPGDHGEAYLAWRERWLERAHPECVWVGRPEHLVYPWSEPDLGAWNPVTEREEPGWTLMPPEACLAHRRAPRRSALRAQLQPQPAGPLRPADHVVHAALGSEAVIADLDGAACYALEGASAALWAALLERGGVDAAAEAIARDYDVERDVARADAEALADELHGAGLIEGHAP